MPSVPWPVPVLLGAPAAALLASFFLVAPRRPEWTHLPILASCAAVCAAAAALAARVYTGWGADLPLFTWMAAGDWGVSFGVRLDGLSVGVLSMVAPVGALIHLYAAGYMRGDPGFARFFMVFHLFYLAMIGLLLSNNLVQLYLFWELVGACSYLLIGHWHHKAAARKAALQAFLVNRLGDFGLLLAVLILLSVFRTGTARFAVLFPLAATADPALLALCGLLIFWAACAKSAQFPLYFWLPDAMEGPTPVSALMHAATMVTAGIFLLARCWPLISLVEGLPALVSWVGGATAFFAALLAATRTDLKRILAYSTVSHLGLMALALGLGEVGVSVLHLVTHGFFKAVLFLCAGNIAHALGRSTVGVSEVGGLRSRQPLTFACFLLAALSLAGVWPFAGFYSKDAILDAALHAGGGRAALALATSALSAFYIFRMLFLAFFGPGPEQAGPGRAHEAEPVMSVPVCFLAIGAVGAGWLRGGFARLLSSGWLGPREALALPEPALGVALAGTAMAAAGALAAWAWTLGAPGWDWAWRRRHPRLEGAFDSDLGWRPAAAAAGGLITAAADRVGLGWDAATWDRWLEGGARGVSRVGGAVARLSTGSVNDALWWMLAGTAAVLAVVIR